MLFNPQLLIADNRYSSIFLKAHIDEVVTAQPLNPYSEKFITPL